MYIRSLTAMLLIAGAVCAADGRQLSYFIPPADNQDPTPFASKVSQVLPGSPAEIAGIRVGDILIGADGKRAFGRHDMRVLDALADHLDQRKVHLIRQSRLVTISVDQLIGPGRIGIEYEDSPATLTALLNKLEIAPADLLREAFHLPSERKLHPVEIALLDNVPVRVVHDLGISQDKDWIRNFARVFLQISKEDYAAVKKIIETTNLLREAPSPFLQDLLTLYQRIAADPPAYDRFPIAGYNAEPEFIAICYPYPFKLLESSPTAFADEPEFRKQYLAVYEGSASEREAAVKALRPERGLNGLDKYLAQTRHALVSNVRPTRGPKDLAPELFKRIEGDSPSLTAAYALLFLNMSNKTTMEPFKRAYAVIMKAGSRERALADGLLKRYIECFHAAHGNIQGVYSSAATLRPTGDTAAIYHCLAKLNGFVRYRTQTGTSWLDGTQNRRLSTSVQARLCTLQALRDPVEAANHDELIAEAAGSDDPDFVFRAARVAMERLRSFKPGRPDFAAFEGLFVKLLPFQKTELMMELLECHRALGLFSSSVQKSLLPDMITADARGLQKIASLNAGSEHLEATCRAIMQKHGLPLVQLQLGLRLTQIGEPELATPYLRRAGHFYSTLVDTYGDRTRQKRQICAAVAKSLPPNPYTQYAIDKAKRVK